MRTSAMTSDSEANDAGQEGHVVSESSATNETVRRLAQDLELTQACLVSVAFLVGRAL
jgi:hypothetical protein